MAFVTGSLRVFKAISFALGPGTTQKVSKEDIFLEQDLTVKCEIIKLILCVYINLQNICFS